MYNTNATNYELSTEEYFINLEDIPETPSEIKAYIPKLMPRIPQGDGPLTNIKLQVNRSLLINARECAVISTPQVVNSQNYLTLKPSGNESPNFRSKATLKDGAYIVPKGNQFILSILHGDIGNMYFTGKI